MSLDTTMNVLVVDDYQTMTRIITNILKQIGFENVVQANDGPTALSYLNSRTFGLILSDWNMEPMSGLELLKSVRAQPALKKIPFIMVTAESKKENVLAAKEFGVSNYIVKPFNAESLRAKINSVFPEMV